MPARRASESGLASEQLAHLADEVAAGRTPRVRLSGAQFPDGTSGTVLRIGDPATDGDDFVLVRVKVHGVTDELRFSPRELSVGRRRSVPVAPAAVPAAKRPSRPRAAAKATPPVTKVEPAPPAKAAARSAARRTTPTPTVTITMTSSGSSWSVAARRGAKTVIKRAEITPGAVAAIAALLGDPGVEDAVAAVNDSARAEAEARAEQLRAELAAVEAVLVSHQRP